MLNVFYNSEGIRVEVGNISKLNKNLPWTLNVKKHVSGDIQWSTTLEDYWFATYPNTEMFDIEIIDSRGFTIFAKKWNIVEHGNFFYKSLWLYNLSLIREGKLPKGLVIGTHDGEFGEWVPSVLNRECSVTLVEASDKQYNQLIKNYKNNSLVTTIQNLITPHGGEVNFYEGGAGYTNSVIERVINHWEKEQITSKRKSSISITDLVIKYCGGKLDWLHLDVEGLDASLVLALREDLLPNLIIFEDANLLTEEKNNLMSFLENKGYCSNSENGICMSIK